MKIVKTERICFLFLQNLKQTLTCTNYKSIQSICMRKNYKTSKHQNKIHILQKKYAKIINNLKLSWNKKKNRFVYLKWRIFNKIWIRIRMLKNWVLWWLNLLWEVEFCWDWGEGVTICYKKKKHDEEEEIGEGRPGGSIARS